MYPLHNTKTALEKYFTTWNKSLNDSTNSKTHTHFPVHDKLYNRINHSWSSILIFTYLIGKNGFILPKEQIEPTGFETYHGIKAMARGIHEKQIQETTEAGYANTEPAF